MDVALLIPGDSGWGDEMLWAAGMTLLVAVLSYLLGIVLGITAAAMKLSRFASLRACAAVYTTVVRGIPELLIIYLIFFGGSTLLNTIANALFGFEGYIDLPVLAIGVICIGLSVGAYSTEVIRGAVQAVPVGLLEAGKSIGMSTGMRFRRILAPLAARHALPGLANVWQMTLKETSLISVIGLVEIMRQATIAMGSTKQPFTFFLTAFLLYLALTSISNRGFIRLERWANRGVKAA